MSRYLVPIKKIIQKIKDIVLGSRSSVDDIKNIHQNICIILYQPLWVILNNYLFK